jgi:hypothetical protein
MEKSRPLTVRTAIQSFPVCSVENGNEKAPDFPAPALALAERRLRTLQAHYMETESRLLGVKREVTEWDFLAPDKTVRAATHSSPHKKRIPRPIRKRPQRRHDELSNRY